MGLSPSQAFPIEPVTTASTPVSEEAFRSVSTPVMAEEAYYGLAGRVVRAIEPYSEADPVGVLTHVLLGVGSQIGREPHALAGHDVHTGAEYAALVGDTSKGRKGQSWSTPRYIFSLVDGAWLKTRVKSGLSSGEGLIHNVRDERREMQPVRGKGGKVEEYEEVIVDEGVKDKRLLVFEPELASVLRRMQGQTNTLSTVLRDAWDTGSLSTLTKHSPDTATGAHISLVAHVTREELQAALTDVDRANGFANRFLYLFVCRSKCLPDPGEIPNPVLMGLVDELREVVRHAGPGARRRDSKASALWASVYPKLSEGQPGLIGGILARAEAHVLRLSLLYAVLDRATEIQEPHLRAALAVWDYAAASARRIFSPILGLSLPDIVLAALRLRGPLTLTDIRDLFQRNKTTAQIQGALAILFGRGLVRSKKDRPAGGKGKDVTTYESLGVVTYSTRRSP